MPVMRRPLGACSTAPHLPMLAAMGPGAARTRRRAARSCASSGARRAWRARLRQMMDEAAQLRAAPWLMTPLRPVVPFLEYGRLAYHRAVDDVLHLLPIIITQLARSGRADNADEVEAGVAEELRPEGAVPRALAGAAGLR